MLLIEEDELVIVEGASDIEWQSGASVEIS